VVHPETLGRRQHHYLLFINIDQTEIVVIDNYRSSSQNVLNIIDAAHFATTVQLLLKELFSLQRQTPLNVYALKP